jgi:hypothetical protein
MRIPLALLLTALLSSAFPARALETADRGETQSPSIRYDHEEAQAYLWSLGGVVLPMGAAFALAAASPNGDMAWPIGILGVGALTVGPSMGQFKAGAVGHGVAASALRGAGQAIAIVALLRSLCIMCDAEEANAKPSPVGGLVTGAALYLGGTVYSLVNIHRTYDAKRESAFASNLRFAPTLALDRDRRIRPGAALSLTF